MATFESVSANCKAGQTVAMGEAPSGSEKDILIGLNIANLDSSESALVDASILNGSTRRYICKNVSIPVGGAVELIQGKFVLEVDDGVEVTSTKEVDIWKSRLDAATA